MFCSPTKYFPTLSNVEKYIKNYIKLFEFCNFLFKKPFIRKKIEPLKAFLLIQH